MGRVIRYAGRALRAAGLMARQLACCCPASCGCCDCEKLIVAVEMTGALARYNGNYTLDAEAPVRYCWMHVVDFDCSYENPSSKPAGVTECPIGYAGFHDALAADGKCYSASEQRNVNLLGSDGHTYMPLLGTPGQVEDEEFKPCLPSLGSSGTWHWMADPDGIPDTGDEILETGSWNFVGCA